MIRDELLSAASTPLASPSYPKGPYRFIGREYLLIHYPSDPDVIREMLPEPLEPDGNHVIFEWMKMLDSSGFGSYQESGINIAAKWDGTPCNFSVMMFLDDESSTTSGCEIWGFAKKIGQPDLPVVHDTLTGTLHYDGRVVALGTMGYKYQSLAQDHGETLGAMGKLTVNLKLIPDVDGSSKVAQLVGYHLQDVELKGAWLARLACTSCLILTAASQICQHGKSCLAGISSRI